MTISTSSKMYLIEQNPPQHNSTPASLDMIHNNSITSLNSLNSCSNGYTNNKNLVTQSFITLDSPLSSISSCESGIDQNSPPCHSITNNNTFNCETDCLLTIDQQMNSYQPNSYIANYSSGGEKMKSQLSGSSVDCINSDKNDLLNYDYVDSKFDNVFYTSWNSNESINNLTYGEPLDGGNDNEYFMLNSRSTKVEEQSIESNLNLSANNGDQHKNKNEKHLLSDTKKTNLLTASESQQLAELLTLDDLNANSIDNCIQLDRQVDQFESRANWQSKSIFDWTNQEFTEFLFSIALQYSHPIDDLRAYFLCYSPGQLANMDKEQLCCINSKYGSAVYQAICQFKIDFNSTFTGHYFNQQSTNFQSTQPTMQASNSNKLISNYNENHLNESSAYLTNLPSFDLLRNSCYDLDCTDQSPSSSLSDSDRDSTSSSMTAVNEHLNRQMASSNSQQQVASNDGELFCLANAAVVTDCNRLHNNQHQFHQVIQNTHPNSQSNLANRSTNLTNLTNASLTNQLQQSRVNAAESSSDKKCDLNNNTINDMMTTNATSQTLSDVTVSIDETVMNDHLTHRSNVHQSIDYANINLTSKNNSLITNLDENFHQSYVHQTSHNFDSLNNLNQLNHHLDRSSNTNSINKLTITGRRGRPPKKDSKGRNRQSRGKGNGKLWEFIRDLLLDPTYNPSFIRWERREDGVFKFVQSDKVAKLWGQRKQNPRMTYEKLSRAMRYYYKSQVLMPVFGRRLVYKFGPNATGWFPITT